MVVVRRNAAPDIPVQSVEAPRFPHPRARRFTPRNAPRPQGLNVGEYPNAKNKIFF
jgi:hypothetical protein